MHFDGSEFWSEIVFALLNVMSYPMMLAKVVGTVIGSGLPVIFESKVETHVQGFRAVRLDVVVDNAKG